MCHSASHYQRAKFDRHTCQMTPSRTRRVKPVSAHVSDNASHHWRACQTLRGHYRRAQPISSLVTHRARPLSVRQPIIGPRGTERAPPSTHEAIVSSRSINVKPPSARKPLSAPAPQRREAMTGARRHPRRAWKTTRSEVATILRLTERTRLRRRRNGPKRSRPRDPRPDGPRVPTGPEGLAYVSRCEAIIGMRSHYRHKSYMTPSPHQRVKPSPAHVRDYASPHWRTP